ncbi:MAG: hypothetical protein ACKO2G_10900 [Verrucomicrobiales bacterium]
MRAVMILPAAGFLLFSCAPPQSVQEKPADLNPTAAKSTDSEALARNFPLLPLIEPVLWKELQEAEAKLATAFPSERVAADQAVTMLSEKLRNRHPFKAEGSRLELGGIICDKKDGRLSLPAKVHFPDPGDERHPGEVELFLCAETGRTHETLFITQSRPLHLELLLHLCGHAKGEEGARFRIDVLTGDGIRIPVHSLLRAKGEEKLPDPLSWEFSGSDYKGVYSPDLSGDLAIFWHAHDSVLRVAHEGIASGEVKLEAVPHHSLKNGDHVVLEFIRMGVTESAPMDRSDANERR